MADGRLTEKLTKRQWDGLFALGSMATDGAHDIWHRLMKRKGDRGAVTTMCGLVAKGLVVWDQENSLYELTRKGAEMEARAAQNLYPSEMCVECDRPATHRKVPMGGFCEEHWQGQQDIDQVWNTGAIKGKDEVANTRIAFHGATDEDIADEC